MIGIYVRVSSSNQVVEGFSIDVQKQMGIDFAKSLKSEYIIYEDLGLSGGSIEKRKGYQRMIYDIEHNIIDTIWVRDTSRLNRDLLNSVEFRLSCLKNKVILYGDGRKYDFNQPQDVVMLDVFNVFSEYQRKYSGGLSSQSKERLLENGIYILGSIPFGYKRVEGKLEVSEIDVKILNTIWKYAKEGNSLRQIKSELVLEYGEHITRNGKILSFQVMWISRILRNELYYTGKFETKYRDKIYQWDIEPLLDYETWKYINKEYTEKIKLRRVEKLNVLEGKLYCSVCNNKLYFYLAYGYKGKKDREKKKYYYAQCGNEKCSIFRKNAIEEKILMKDFMVFFSKIKNSDKIGLIEEFRNTINNLYNEHKTKLVGFDRKMIVKKIEKLEEQRERLKNLYFIGDLVLEEYKERKFLINTEIGRLEDKLLEEGKIYDDELIIKYLDHIQKLSENKNDSYIVKNLIDKIYVRKVIRDWFDGGYRIFYKIDWNFLGRIDNKLKLVLFLTLSNLFNIKSNSYNLTLNTNKVKINERFFKLIIEFYVKDFKIIIQDCYFEYVFL
jgi:site-specific DNA recombinase